MPNALDVDKPGDAGDWRMHLVARVHGDQGQYRDNDIIRHVVAATDKSGLTHSYAAPSFVALALNVSEQAAQSAESLRLKVPWQPMKADGAPAVGVATEGIPPLFDFFEQCMISAVFAYQAVETFCNGVIGRELQGTMKVRRGRKSRELAPDQIARQLTTQDKLVMVLPKIRSVESPEGTSKLRRFERLGAIRDATVHLKVHDHFGKDWNALVFRLLDIKATEFPSAAAMMIYHYFKPDAEPRWLLRFLKVRDHS